MMVCETSRLRLRHLTLDDAAFILRLLNEPSFIDNVADRGVRTLEDARAYLAEGPIQHYDTFGYGPNLVELKTTGEPIGICGLIKREALPYPDIGYAFFPEYGSYGYATEAVRAVIEYARKSFQMECFVAVVNPGNDRSIRLLEKVGFRFRHMMALFEGEPDIRVYDLQLS